MAGSCLREGGQTKLITATNTQELEKEKVKQLRILLTGLEDGDKEETMKAIEKVDFWKSDLLWY